MPPAKPGAKRIQQVAFENDLSSIEVGGTSTGVGTGGAVTKVSAAKLANQAGIPVLLTSTANITQALDGQDVGTWFEADALAATSEQD